MNTAWAACAQVVYVRIPVELAKQRAALRKRSVSPEKIAAYQQKIAGVGCTSRKHLNLAW